MTTTSRAVCPNRISTNQKIVCVLEAELERVAMIGVAGAVIAAASAAWLVASWPWAS